MTITLYSAPVSPYGNIADVAMQLLDVDFELSIVSPHSKRSDFQKASPLGRLPAVNADGVMMSDSDAIASYFDFKAHNNGPNSLYGGDPESRAKIMFIEKYAQTEGRIVSVGVMSLKLEGNTDAAMWAKRVEAAQPVLANLNKWVQDNGFFVGGGHTIADVTVFCQLLAHITTGQNFDKYPRLVAFYNKMLQHPVFNATHERSLGAIKMIEARLKKQSKV